MKALQKITVGTLVCLTALLANSTSLAQTTSTDRTPPANWLMLNPVFADNPAALQLISNLLAEPQPALSIPTVSRTNNSTPGTYWTLHNSAPLPFNPYPDLPVYSVGTNNQYLIDDSSVDYAALDEQIQEENEIAGLTNAPIGGSPIDTNGLYLQVPTNSLATPDYFTVNVMNTIIGQSYDILTKSALNLSSWTTVLTTNAVANVTQVQVPMSSTNLFVWARESTGDYSFYVNMPPLSQDVEDGDSVTFGVDTGGNTNLTYQWLLNGVAIDGATNSTYTINNVQDSDAGDYAVTISDGTNSLTTTSGQLTTDSSNSFGYTQTGDYNLVPILGSRQDYTFKSGNTYYISSQTTFYGKTTIEGGAVIKPDWYSGGSIQIIGTLDCKTEPYFPAILTSVDDDSVGEILGFSQQDGPPFTAENGIPYLDMTYAESNSISNLRICFADEGVTTPVASRKLNVWDCQFVECNYGIVNLVAGTGADDSLHNVLFAGCGAAIGASSNSIAIDGEQVTADVSDFCAANATPSNIALTNSILWGDSPTASSLSTINVFQNPNDTNFVSEDGGDYYLAANSPLHNAGTTNISLRLQTELQHKTTYAPIAIAVNTTVTGDLTLSPQAQRYTNGAPDIGYYYDALDYSVANLTVNGGNITVLPNTAIAVRNDYNSTNSTYTYEGFFVREGSSFESQGTPTKPNVFTAEKMVQEFPDTGFAQYRYNEGWWFGVVTFVTDSEPDEQNLPAAIYNFRFSKFYLPVGDYHFWSGYDEYEDYQLSYDSSMYLALQDCQIYGGRINLGNPDQSYYPLTQVYPAGALTWINNSFENTAINLDPTYYWYNGTVNCDMQLIAYNNLFKGGAWLRMEPFPASAGNWTFENNLFDKVNFLQDTSKPLDYDYNGYWPLQPREFLYSGSAGEFATTTTSDGFTDGGHEVILSNAPPYQIGVFGDFYLPTNTPLYGAGSTNAAGMGLYQYTTRLDQTKEGDEAAGHMVNIGVHYVAANGNVPKDTDGDGIPDYVEDANGNGIVDFNTAENVNETDWQNPMTDGVTNDAYNVAYDDVDLSGDGIVGRIKKALGMNPFDTSNPLTLTQVITGQEPEIATFEVPISYNLLTNIGSLYLLVDENQGGEFQSYSRASDGNCLLTWNTTFDSPGQHYLQVQLNLNGQIEGGDEPAPTVLAAVGNLDFYQSTNVCQFDPSFSAFSDNGATLYATTPTCSNANYTIELQTASGQHIKTITNSTSTGIISEHWDLTDDNGNLVTNNAIKAIFNVTLLDPGMGISIFWLHRITAGLGTDGKFTVAYAWDVPSQAQSDGTMWNAILGGVVNPLLTPVTADGGFSDNYSSDFDRYTGDNYPDDPGSPGYISTQIPDVLNLVLTNLPNINTMNFYWDGHGSPTALGDGNRQQVAIGIGQVASALKK
jgi:Immunoglobulin domain